VLAGLHLTVGAGLRLGPPDLMNCVRERGEFNGEWSGASVVGLSGPALYRADIGHVAAAGPLGIGEVNAAGADLRGKRPNDVEVLIDTDLPAQHGACALRREDRSLPAASNESSGHAKTKEGQCFSELDVTVNGLLDRLPRNHGHDY